MAVSISIVDRFKYGNAMTVVADVAFDASYPTGGEAITPGSFGLAGFYHIPDFVATSSAGGYIGRWNQSKTAAKLVLYSYDTTIGGASDAAALTYADPAAITYAAPAALTYAAPAALTSAQLTGGESPTEGEYNQLQADVAAIRTALLAAGVDLGVLRTPIVATGVDVAAIRTALLAAGVDLGVIRTALVALTGTKTGVLGQVPDTTNLLSTPVTARLMVIGY